MCVERKSTPPGARKLPLNGDVFIGYWLSMVTVWSSLLGGPGYPFLYATSELPLVMTPL